jgi:hypothetical protein
LSYRPTPGLISLFSKIGARGHNPKPAKQVSQAKRSYADIGMDHNGTPSNFNCLGMGPRGHPSGIVRGAGQAKAFCGGFTRPPHQGFGGGMYGRRGGVNWFHQQGRGFDGRPMPQHRGF